MSVASQTFRFVPIKASTAPLIYNVTSPGTANTEFSQALSNGTKQLTIRCRGQSDIQLAWVATESSTNYITIPACSSYNVTNLELSSKTVYLQVDQASQIIEIEEWS